MGGEPPPDKTPFEEEETRDAAEGVTRSTPGGVGAPSSGGQPRGPSLQAGGDLGGYRLISLLGRGGFGQVWEAEGRDTGRRVALKVLHARSLTPEVLQRFEREGRLAAALNHPRCVFVLAAEHIDGSPTIAMELMPGGTLGDLLQRRGALPTTEAVDYALQILDGLEAAHAAGILHRDLKPSNCFLDAKGEARIGDFGLSRTVDFKSDLTVAGSFMGTPSYAAPEQVRGQDVDVRADLYSFGATVYALLAGKPPFDGRQPGEVLSRILTEPPPPFAAHGVHVPKGLEAVILRLLAKDPERRGRGYAAVRAALFPFSSRGLTAGSLSRRLAAFFVDLLPLSLLESLAGLVTTGPVAGSVVRVLACLLYFLGTEGRWGRSPGKALFGLRVTGADGPVVRFRAILVRTLVFVALFRLEDLLGVIHLVAGLKPGWLVAVGAALAQLALLATMRRRNGFAGLHELASGTRVRFVRSRAAVSAVPVASPPAGDPGPAAPRTFGPYREAGSVWRTASEEVLVAWDPALERSVWIHILPERDAPPSDDGAIRPPTRLRSLQCSREGGAGWDAYEHPGGISLVEWVERSGRLSWAEMRGVLLGVARSLAEDESALPLTVSRVWIDAAGRGRFLPFPVRLDQPEAGSWRAFLHQLALFGLEGRLVAAADLSSQQPRAAVPEHAREVLRRICGGAPPFESASAVVAELEEIAARPTRISRSRRAASLLLPVAPVAFVTVVAILALLVLERLTPGLKNIVDLEEQVELYRELETASGPGAEEKRRAIRVVLAGTRAALDDAGRGKEIVSELPDEVRGPLEAAHRAHPRPSLDEVAQARRTLGLPEGDARKGRRDGRFIATAHSGDTPATALRDVMEYLGLLGVVAVMSSPWLRGGPVLYLFGLTLQRQDGRRVGRLRALLRTVLAWLPFIVALVLTGLEVPWTPLTPLGAPLALAALAGLAWAVVHPDRGIPDLLADTRLVPR
jgi:eukaryotic-like serine/threonine-protein kinase